MAQSGVENDIIDSLNDEEEVVRERVTSDGLTEYERAVDLIESYYDQFGLADQPVDLSQLQKLKFVRHSTKVSWLVTFLKSVLSADPTDKIVVVSQFVDLIIKVGEALSQSKILCQLYHGGLSTYNRKQGLQRFNHDPTMRVMVMSLKAGGIGLNLQRANHMVILDRWWNPATMDQAVARIHRMTQAKQTYVHTVVIKDTIEESLMDTILGKKNKLFQQIVENEDVDGENVEEDIKELEISEAQEQVQTDDVDDAEEEEDDDDEMHELEIIIPNDKRKPAEVITLDDDDDIPTTLKEITIGDNGSNYFDPITLDDDMDDELHEIEIIIRNDEQESFSKDFSKDFPRDFFDEFSGEIQELENNITQEELCAFTEMDLT